MASLPYLLQSLTPESKRSITLADGTGTAIIPGVVVSEDHADEVAVSRHPVDTGAPIADHAYRLPASVVCTFGWGSQSSSINSLLSGSPLRGRRTSAEVYQQFLDWMAARKILSLSTGKRLYPAVLITGLKTSSTVDTENALVLEITFEEVLLVSPSETTLEAAAQKSPQKTASPTSGGNRNGSPTPFSAAGMA